MRTFRDRNNQKPLQRVVGVGLCSGFMLLTSAAGVVVIARPGWTLVFLCPIEVMAGQVGWGANLPFYPQVSLNVRSSIPICY